MPLGEEIPLERGHQRGVPPLEIVILPLLAHLAWKWLQIDADLLRTVASTVDELSSGTLNPKIEVFSDFLAILGCNTHLETELRQTIQDRPGQPAYEMFGIKGRFQRCKVWSPRFKESAIQAHQIRVPPWKSAISATVD